MIRIFFRRTHRDPEIYHEPDVFKPERFLGIDGRAPEPDPHEYTFGYGRRYVLHTIAVLFLR